MTIQELQKKAISLRVDALTAISKAGSGCVGSTMSVMEILVALYYGEMYGKRVVRLDKMKPGWEDQDYVILAKGQASPAQYVILADLGFFDKSELDHYRQKGSLLSAQPAIKIPGITLPGGSAGQGLSMATGLAMSLKMDRKNNRVFTVIGDGELQEGQTWEAAMAASHYKLNNLFAFVDNNKLQAGGTLKAVMDIDPIQDKFEAFGWNVIQIKNGHDIDEILGALARAFTSNRRPSLMWCHTVSGKRVPFAEDKSYYHRAAFSEAELDEAVRGLETLLNKL